MKKTGLRIVCAGFLSFFLTFSSLSGEKRQYLSGSFNAEEEKIVVERGIIGRSLENMKQPEGENVFYLPVDRLYCFTWIRGAKPPTHIIHAWYLNEKKVAEVKLSIKKRATRTYSSKIIPQGFEGKGKCIVFDEEGFNLATIPFEVRKK